MASTRSLALAAFWTFGSFAGCVNVDPNTGETIPRGNQRYEYSRVTDKADELQKGQSKFQVLLLLGSPAEKSTNGDVWVYLPERPAILVPGSALRLEFHGETLDTWGYHPIILGARL